ELSISSLSVALVAMAAELIQEDLTLTRRVGETVSFSCGGTDHCYYVFWYQKKDTETFRIIVVIRDGKVDSFTDQSERDDFSAERTANGWELKIKKIKSAHSASYYCSCDTNIPTQNKHRGTENH
uniref:Immunoglobulin V-set domain-containing protein n=1 Tax=Salarias fasciatus TaxID=181472 RepID=A0A672GFG5_SALFA